MKILIINTAENKGGAAVACNRLHEALLQNNIDSKMLVRQKSSNDATVYEFTSSKIRKKINLFFFFLELFILKFFKKEGVDFSLPWFGPALHKHPLVKEADVIHLHWVQNSYVSLNCLKKLQSLNKPIIWTLHDMWAFTGGCHYNIECRKFESSCSKCPQLKNTNIVDFSKNTFTEKEKIFTSKLRIVTPSKWLAKEASLSSLLNKNEIDVIPYNINFDLFKPVDKKVAKENFGINPDKKVILFVSMNIEDQRKGFNYFKKAIIELENSIPNWCDEYEILAIGRNSDLKHFETKINYTGRLSNVEKISMAYAAADVFVAPSTQDNLPNTVIESLACGTPVVAFNIGGMPDMIDSKINGYIAEFDNHLDLSQGILYCINHNLSENARKSAESKFQSSVVAEKYVDLYRNALHEKS